MLLETNLFYQKSYADMTRKIKARFDKSSRSPTRSLLE
jgi:hypothetical protein